MKVDDSSAAMVSNNLLQSVVGTAPTAPTLSTLGLRVHRYQQRGKAAEEAANMFYYLTYEGTVDLDDIDDPLQRKVTTWIPGCSCTAMLLPLPSGPGGSLLPISHTSQ